MKRLAGGRSSTCVPDSTRPLLKCRRNTLADRLSLTTDGPSRRLIETRNTPKTERTLPLPAALAFPRHPSVFATLYHHLHDSAPPSHATPLRYSLLRDPLIQSTVPPLSCELMCKSKPNWTYPGYNPHS